MSCSKLFKVILTSFTEFLLEIVKETLIAFQVSSFIIKAYKYKLQPEYITYKSTALFDDAFLLLLFFFVENWIKQKNKLEIIRKIQRGKRDNHLWAIMIDTENNK